ncbi:hypothetical protein [Rhizobium laguerreae]|uniref:hypothetical protein n=1 Tax=Rhizobium laguerreae TaxID=1076926 RepID=UPI001C8FCE0A|nr:hypothetical protein [Rhizobium laguerreae]MBY3225254.1 hypothetical protein [Rhizobium laguerreae]
MTSQDDTPADCAAVAAHQLVETLAADGIALSTIARALVLEGAAVLAVSGADAAVPAVEDPGIPFSDGSTFDDGTGWA